MEKDPYQTGPGMIGSLAPVGKASDKLTLLNEKVEIRPDETGVTIAATYVVFNWTETPVTQKIGVPFLNTDQNDFRLKFYSLKKDNRNLPFEIETWEKTNRNFNYTPYLVFGQQNRLSHRWHTTSVEFPAKTAQVLHVEARLDYLFTRTFIQGRRTDSKKLFRFERSFVSRWGTPPKSSIVYVEPKYHLAGTWKLTPRNYYKDRNRLAFKGARRKLTSRDAITLVYDPIEFDVSPYGLQNARIPIELEEGEKDFSYSNLFDGDPSTAWCEGEFEGGVNKSFEIQWGKGREVESIEIIPGAKDRNRPKKVNIYMANPGWLSKPISRKIRNKLSPTQIPIKERGQFNMMVLEIKDIYRGKHNDTCISEVKVNFSDRALRTP